jgi:glutamyl-tRNA reductase
LNNFKIIAFTHKNIDISDIGHLHIDADFQEERLKQLKAKLQLTELLFLSTCNRVEYLFVFDGVCDVVFLEQFFFELYPDLDEDIRNRFIETADIFDGEQAVEHVLRVASSIDSMVIGEREIITQVRSAFESCKRMGLTGDFIRLLMRNTIETAKKVYTKTSISTKPVSVVSLAYQRLRDMNIPLDARFIIIGAGVTNTNMSRFLRKHGFTNFVVFNRTLHKAQQLATELKGVACPLTDLPSYTGGFDVIITCTGSENHLITPDIYKTLLQGDKSKKTIIDLAIPYDLDPQIVANHSVHHISVDYLKIISEANLKERAKEIQHVEAIIHEELLTFHSMFRQRQIEIAMREVPQKIKDIKETAKAVFAQDLANMDASAVDTMERMLTFIEKKYMSVPMKMAKEILIKS